MQSRLKWAVSHILKQQEPAADAVGVRGSRVEYTRRIEPARALVDETMKLERTVSDLANQGYGLTPAELALMWQTGPPLHASRRPHPDVPHRTPTEIIPYDHHTRR